MHATVRQVMTHIVWEDWIIAVKVETTLNKKWWNCCFVACLDVDLLKRIQAQLPTISLSSNPQGQDRIQRQLKPQTAVHAWKTN